MLMWHYTSVDVMASIFANERPTLRASNVLHLNDSAELKHGLNALKSLFNNMANNSAEFTQNLLEKMLNDEYDPEIYSFSLSKSKNSLYQWIAYCPPQGGIALGFDLPDILDKQKIGKEELFYLPLPAKPGHGQIPQYGKCHYFREIEQVESDWIEIRAHKDPEVNLLTNAIFYKHEAFHFEHEYRLFFHPTPDNPDCIPIQFNGNKPYVNFHFKREVLKQVFVSPRGDKKLTVRTVKKILRLNGLGHVDIVVSDIPFRE